MLRDSVSAFLSAHGFRLEKKFGQNYLIEQEVLDVIVETADLKKTDRVVEIGPGIGILTKELLPRVGSVTAIELDARVLPLLLQYCKPVLDAGGKMEIIQGNALSVPFPETPYKIVANIPYHITSPLLRHAFLESTRPPEALTLMIQREVAEKIVDTEHAGLLTILVAIFGTPELVAIVPPKCFLPPPEVDSAILHIRSHEKPLADAATVERIFRLTKIAFGQKRKMLRNSLGHFPEGAKAMEEVGIDPMRRPETLDIEEWIDLAAHWFSESKELETVQTDEENS